MHSCVKDDLKASHQREQPCEGLHQAQYPNQAAFQLKMPSSSFKDHVLDWDFMA